MTEPLRKVKVIREAVGPDIDLMVDVHGPPWLTTRDAIRLGQALEEYDLLFYEDPVAPEDIEALARVADAVDLPIAAGERHSHIYGVRQLIEREIVDVIQPDTGRAGGLMQMKKMAAMAEAHYITFAPHSGSLGPVAEVAGLHLLATLPNFLIMEHLEDDVPQRYEVIDAPARDRGRAHPGARRARSGRGHCRGGDRQISAGGQRLRAQPGGGARLFPRAPEPGELGESRQRVTNARPATCHSEERQRRRISRDTH